VGPSDLEKLRLFKLKCRVGTVSKLGNVAAQTTLAVAAVAGAKKDATRWAAVATRCSW
jgi:hypothetical protein